MIMMLQSGLNINPVITHEFSVNNFQEAFDVMRSGQSGKVIMQW
jgi:threonine 3-dehydrogenase